MTFMETCSALWDKTEKITVYAAQAYDYVNGDHVPSIGIRSFFAGYPNNDVKLDDVCFMICGTIYFSNGKKVKNIDDLNDMWTADSEYFVKLRAVSVPGVTIDLGTYDIIVKTRKDTNGTVIITLWRRS